VGIPPISQMGPIRSVLDIQKIGESGSSRSRGLFEIPGTSPSQLFLSRGTYLLYKSESNSRVPEFEFARV
jgi:hypothetical protein